MEKAAETATESMADRPNVVRRRPMATVDDLLKHVDPGPPEETEKFIQFIYALRRGAMTATDTE